MKSQFLKVAASITVVSAISCIAATSVKAEGYNPQPPATNPVNLSIGIGVTPNGTVGAGLSLSETGQNTSANAFANSSVFVAPDGTSQSADFASGGGSTYTPYTPNYYIWVPEAVPGSMIP